MCPIVSIAIISVFENLLLQHYRTRRSYSRAGSAADLRAGRCRFSRILQDLVSFVTKISTVLQEQPPTWRWSITMTMGSAVIEAGDYVLGRSITDSVRNDAEHLLWKFHKGYELHPAIPVSDKMRIADLGCGTGIWLLDLARQLPPTVQLHGFDVCDKQYPAQPRWPQNMTLSVIDMMADLPPSIVGQYDVVHLRMWVNNVRDEETATLIGQAKRLLKPGGYIQWEEADLDNQVTEGLVAEKTAARMSDLMRRVNLNYSWVSELPERLRKENLEVVESDSGRFAPHLVDLCTRNYILTLRELTQGIKKGLSADMLLAVSEQEVALQCLATQQKEKIVYNWSPVTVLAQHRV
ncbi:class I SAM-dependent methyltransferase [Aspergillus saccharolyticus JOP 1030-1]|uniref:S-adenosyl-L-methionine-dependent methyltransferase n=1 Tax=Aspergillus saccharolyticus JOP 1030-1 TaxID=1450539 RepID=A0A318ZQ48_9EURO|nr:S-adenosyl-L-methionine-dependent methyltransferase [Aspergillus saccharolyticus JOP 1030-1]PYH49751.1 S-adenosyl-L-methionine-dependent methyltransferase [Aspergillus saccharolyticus JOP 1030-1]